MEDVREATKRPVYHEQECSKFCEDPWCPYTHSGGWEVNGEFYANLADAEAAISASEPQP